MNQVDEAWRCARPGTNAHPGHGLRGARAAGDVVAHDLRPVIYNPETVDRLEALAAQARRQVRVHVKVETGTHRQGCSKRLPSFAERIRRSPTSRWRG